MNTIEAATDVVRYGDDSATVRVWTDDKATALRAAVATIQKAPRYAGRAYVATRAARLTIHTLGYEGPGYSVTVKAVQN